MVHMLYGGGGGEANVVGWVVGFGVRLEKILLRMVMAHHYASPGCWKGALGCGFVIALVRIVAARCALLARKERGGA